MTTVRKRCNVPWQKKVHLQMANIYHERQIKELCALHALNNLFQNKTYDKKELDGICETLAPNSWFNPHKSMLGLGNYDINVIMIALQSRGYEGIWFDKRKDPQTINLSNIVGFILNTPSDYKFCVVTIRLHRRHWIAIREIDGQYYNLDSKNEVPQILGDSLKLIEFLRSELKNNDRELFIVVTQEVEKNHTWSLDTETSDISEKT